MPGSAQLEISLRPLDDGDYAADVRFLAADSRTEAHLIDGLPPKVALDIELLLSHSLDHAAYGRCLTEMFFADPRLAAALTTARTHAEAADQPLRISLRLDPHHALLHAIRWEALQDPGLGGPLVASERVLLSRYIDSPSTQPVTSRARGALSALIVVAAPQDLGTYQLASINVTGEVARAQAALGQIRTTILASGDQAVTVAALRAALNDMPDILYLVCHGTSPMGRTTLWLEREDRTSARVEGEVFVRQITNLSRRPLLVVIAACQSAGSSHDAGALSTIAPQLAREGVAAVIAMQGNIAQATIATLMPIFFRELLRDGQIDRALASARNAILDRLDWWMPILLLRVRDGRLWLDERASAGDSPALTAAHHIRQRVIQHLREHWINGVLENSLHGAALIALGIEDRPDYVAYPWDMVVEQSGRAARSIPPGTALDRVFDEMGAELLILGTPGAGKTTMLLDLARVLLARAERDDGARLPVVLHLSLWAESRPPLRVWIVSELEERYGVPRADGEIWIAECRIIPLLDGLDEVKLEHRNACVVAINDFWKEYGAGIAVCSRIADYEALTERLRLRGAILLQPLSDAQIDSYLRRAGDQLAGLREVMPSDQALRELAESPLMLSMMALAYQNKRANEILAAANQETRRTQLFESYVQRMLIRPRAGNTIKPEQAISQLSWLARGMVQHSLSVFYLDELQPTWLNSPAGRWGYAIGSSLLIALFSIFSGYIIGSVIASLAILLASAYGSSSFSVLEAARTGGGLGAIAGDLAAGLHLGVIFTPAQLRGVFGKIYTIRRAYWAWKNLRLSIKQITEVRAIRPTTELRDGILLGFSVGAVFGFLLGAIIRTQFVQAGSPIDLMLFAAPLTAFIQRVPMVVMSGLGITGTIILTGNAILSMRRWLLARFARGNAVAGMVSRLFVPLQPVTLSAAAPSFTLALYMALMMSVSRKYVDSIAIGGLTGVGGLLVILLFSGLVTCASYETAPPRTSRTLSKPSKLAGSVSITMILTLIAAISGGLLAALMAWSFIRLSIPSGSQAQAITIHNWQVWVASGMLLAATTASVFTMLSYGLKPILQRSWLRLMLAVTGGLDLAAQKLLEVTTERILLRKVGSGYIFVHRLVLEYFAELNPTQTTALLGSLNWGLIDRGITLRELDQPEQALAAFTQVLEAEPGNYQALTERAMTYRKMERHEDCLVDLDQAINLAYNQYWARVERGITLRTLERYDESITELSRASRLMPKPGRALIERCITYQDLERYQEAVEDATRAIGLYPNAPYYYAWRAVAYRKMGRLQDAREDLKIAITKNSTDTWLLFQMGIVLRLLNYLEDAVTTLQRITEINPNHLGARQELVRTYRTLQQYDEALEQCNYAIQRRPDLAWPYGDRGETYRLMEEYEQALADFTQAIALDAGYVWAYDQRASIFRALERCPEALIDHVRVIELVPDKAWPLIERAITLRQVGDYALALADLDQALTHEPESAWAWVEHGETFGLMGRNEDSLADFAQTITLDANYTWAYHQRALALRTLKRYSEALTDHTQVIELLPDKAWPLIERAITLRETDDYASALADFDQALKNGPENAWSWAERGETYRRMRYYEEAIADFTQAIVLEADYVLAYHQRALTLRMLKRYPEALTDHNRVIELVSGEVVAFITRAITLRQMGNYVPALADLDQALTHEPESIWALEERGETYRLMERYEEALADFTQVIVLDADHVSAYRQRALTLRTLKHYPEALDDLMYAVEQRSNDDWLRYQRGLIYHLVGEHDLAQTDFACAIEIAQAKRVKNPANVQNIFNLAVYLLVHNQGSNATALVQEALYQPVSFAQLQDALNDIAELLSVVPDHPEARTIQELVRTAHASSTGA